MLKLQDMRELLFEPDAEAVTASTSGAVITLPLLSWDLGHAEYAVLRPGKEVLYTNDLLLARTMVGEPALFNTNNN